MQNDNFHISCHLNGKLYQVDLLPNQMDNQNCVVVEGRAYSLKGDEESKVIFSSLLENLPSDAKANLPLMGAELKARLWQIGAQDINVSAGTHQIGLRILGREDLLNKHDVIDNFCNLLERHYVFPDIGIKCSQYLREQLMQGAYDGITDPEAFAAAVTADLRLISNDKHIKVTAPLNDQEIPELSLESIIGPYPQPQLQEDAYVYAPKDDTGLMGSSHKAFPYEFKSGYLEQTPEIGYLDIRIFGFCNLNSQRTKNSLTVREDVEARRAAFVNAIEKIKDAKSVIIDLRMNSGGNPNAVELLCTMFSAEDFPLDVITWRPNEGELPEVEIYQTLPYSQIPLEKRMLMPEVEVVVLTSPQTFSAGESFANNMKVLGRATLVGEITRGGANPGGEPPGDFKIFIPGAEALNRIDEKNWEGVGVIPDHLVPAQDAFDEALNLLKSGNQERQ